VIRVVLIRVIIRKHKLTLSLKNKIVKTIVIINKFNIIINFLNFRDFSKKVM